jgi:type II restriction enzyme
MQLNVNSRHEDEQIAEVVAVVIDDLEKEFDVRIVWEKRIQLKKIIAGLRDQYPDVSFADPEVDASFMSPDGGITFLVDCGGNRYPILIGEVKNQGTNTARLQEGLPRQAKGNAVERLGKNVIGFKTYMLSESIFPYVCFGDGCDFEEGSSILDRVLTIAMFGALNQDHTFNEGPNGIFNRGSYYFRAENWTIDELYDILYDVAKRSIYYYFSKYGEENFRGFTSTETIRFI